MTLQGRHSSGFSDMQDWKVCWKVWQCFVRDCGSPWDTLPLTQQHCPLCNSLTSRKRFASDFLHHAVRCGARHKVSRENAADLCVACEQDVMMKIPMGRMRCFRAECDQVLRVDLDVVTRKLAKRLALNDQCNVGTRYLAIVEQSRSRECLVCLTDQPSENFPERPPTLQCRHKPTVCTACVERMLEVAVSGPGWQRIKCAHNGCKRELGPRDVKTFATAETYTKYDRLMVESSLTGDQRFRWCSGSSGGVGCGNGQICSDGERRPNWRCSRCSTLNCFSCREEAHPGLTCERGKQYSGVEGRALYAAEREAEKISKRCPARGCQKQIKFKAGCHHMTCICGTIFCWECKIIKRRGQSGLHLATCKNSNRLGDGGTTSGPRAGDTMYATDWKEDPNYTGP